MIARTLLVLSTFIWLTRCALLPSFLGGPQNPATNSTTQNIAPGQGTSNLVGGLLGSAAHLVANHEDYRTSQITGRCRCRSRRSDPIDFPCARVSVRIIDGNDREVDRVDLRDDEFAFRVERDQPYRLQVLSTTYRMDPPTTKELYVGDDIELRLFRR